MRKTGRLPLLLGLLLLPALAQGEAAVRGTVVFEHGAPSPEHRAIQKMLEAYVVAIETRDLALFRSAKPNLSAEEERRVKKAFESVQSQVVEITVQSAELGETEATLKVKRRDTINGSIVSSFPQTFSLAKAKGGWSIQDIGR